MSTGGADLVDLAVRVVALGAAVVAVFLVTRDLASLAFVAVVVGTGALVVVLRLGGSSVMGVAVVLSSAARARVTRRGFTGLAAFLGAMAVGRCSNQDCVQEFELGAG